LPVLELEVLNFLANEQQRNVVVGRRVSQIDMLVRAAAVKLLAVASAVGLSHALWVGSRNPLEVSEVPTSATPNQIIDPDNLIISGVAGIAGEIIAVFVNNLTATTTHDYRFRLMVSEVN